LRFSSSLDLLSVGLLQTFAVLQFVAATPSLDKMGRMHSKGKGMSGSALPYKRTPPSWLKVTSEEVRSPRQWIVWCMWEYLHIQQMYL
jgi:hypothetical protein